MASSDSGFWAFVLRALNWLVTLILPQKIDGSCKNHTVNFNDTPSAEEFMSNLEPFQIVFLSVGSALMFALLFLASIHWWYIFNYVSSEQRRNKLYLLISLFPVCSCCCLVGMFCPRTALLVSSFGLLYFLLCLFVLVSLMRHLAGGRAALAYSLSEKGKLIDFRSPPFCCFLCCLPKAKPSVVNLTKLEWIVLQAPIVRVFIVFGQVVVVAEARENAYNWLQFFDLATFASLLLAIFGVHTLARLTSEELSCYGFGGIFRVVDLGLFLFSAQQPFIFQNILLRFGVIHCGVVLSPQDNARFICNFAIICELFLLALFSTFWVSPHRNNLFDQYIRRRTHSSPHRSRTSSFRSVKESRIDETETPVNGRRIIETNSNELTSPTTTTTTQTTILLDLD
ncbi:hypothetical protein Mgra_00009141 [Meloidogyne graminicola]|uniref:Organic solute transporter alpha-like protein n=1 Tax=Meloidogyne graminicola TaxID=189291 RepID=A0A8S9ZDT1_9BILA|nr:hypothetical protein Mgra_00009141 [Meloidogyne graminicola]